MSDIQRDLLEAARGLAAGLPGMRERSERISEHYRQRGASRGVIAGESDALAYGLSRMPATYAAVSRVIVELGRRAPGFSPATLLDAGAGPGTAAWAVAADYPDAALTLMDHNRAFLGLAGQLAPRPVDLVEDDLVRFDFARTFDLVTCAYALTELPDSAIVAVAERLWRHCAGVIVIVEPGRPHDYQRLMAVRERLIGLGGRVLAPCPHDLACPLDEPDWCHFSVRLSRSRDHMRMKGGSLGYEDEKFSYLVVGRQGIGLPATARVLRPPEENKFSVTLSVCAEGGMDRRVVPSRDKAAFKAAGKLGWGDEMA